MYSIFYNESAHNEDDVKYIEEYDPNIIKWKVDEIAINYSKIIFSLNLNIFLYLVSRAVRSYDFEKFGIIYPKIDFS